MSDQHIHYIYIASSPELFSRGYLKIGHTMGPKQRLSTYLTGCPPTEEGAHDLQFYKLYKTTAQSNTESSHCETTIHSLLQKYRLSRRVFGDSEWFLFPDTKAAIEQIDPLVRNQYWYVKTVTLIQAQLESNRFLAKPYNLNGSYIHDSSVRLRALERVQKEGIQSIQEFFESPHVPAAVFIAPCGYGKTVVASTCIRTFDRVIICIPTKIIQTQWYQSLLRFGNISESNIFMIGDLGTTDTVGIQQILQRDTYYCIVSNMSSHLLLGGIDRCQMFVLDEAHHMAGFIGSEEGIGRSRALLNKCIEKGVRRLSLTYTPKYIEVDDVATEATIFSMDNEAVFGPIIYQCSIRTLIREGVLPDYNIWILRDTKDRASGTSTKLDYILEAWQAKDSQNRAILNHCLVFAATIQETHMVEAYLSEHIVDDTAIFRIGSEMTTTEIDRILTRFRESERAILINCRMLNEGVDIPIADSVAILQPKHSKREITQTCLRPGRWYPGKRVFHILLPITSEEDTTDYQDVFFALASEDEVLSESILNPSGSVPVETQGSRGSSSLILDTKPDMIHMDIYGSEVADIQRMRSDLQQRLLRAQSRREIQELCLKRGIDTSRDYARLRSEWPDLPEEIPRGRASIYDFLHPMERDRKMTIQDFVSELHKAGVSSVYKYEAWQNQNPGFPSVLHIEDGYFEGLCSLLHILRDNKLMNTTRR